MKDLNVTDLVTMVVDELKKTSLSVDVSNINTSLLTPKQVCALYPCFNDGTLRDATKNQLPYRKIGKHRFYNAKEIDEWLNKQIIIEGK